MRDLSPHLPFEAALLKKLDKPHKNRNEHIIEGLQTLSNFINYINLELSSVSRSNFRATLPAEKRYHIKYINCVILEAYKYLYGYGSGRKKSLWIKKIKPLTDLIDDQDFKNEYDSLELKIKQFGESNITNLESRDLSFHYDLDPTEVYKNLIELSEEVEHQRLIPFGDLLRV